MGRVGWGGDGGGGGADFRFHCPQQPENLCFTPFEAVVRGRLKFCFQLFVKRGRFYCKFSDRFWMNHGVVVETGLMKKN